MENGGYIDNNTVREDEEIKRRNHSAINDLFKVLNMIKGYEVSYSSSANGKMLVSYEGQLYMLSIEQITGADGLCVIDQFKKYKFLLND